MGARAQVLIKDSGVYLYSHWGSGTIVSDVRKALSKRLRWDDREYLARIIFDVMKRGEESEDLGFGIGTKMHGDIDILVTVDCEHQTVNFGEDDYTFEDFIKSDRVGENIT